MKHVFFASLIAVLGVPCSSFCSFASIEEVCDAFENLALEGQADAHVEIGACYLFGNGRKKSFEEAERWLLKGKALGSDRAAVSLASLYLFKLSDKSKYTVAVAELQRIVASQKDRTAMFSLALAYRNGLGTSVDNARSNELLRGAADSGHVLAKFVIFGQIVLSDSRSMDRCSVDYWRAEVRTAIEQGQLDTVDDFRRQIVKDYLVTHFIFDKQSVEKIADLL